MSWRNENPKNRYQQKLRWQRKHRATYLAGKARENSRRHEWAKLFLNDYKSGHPCVCGESDPIALDFHHLHPKQKNGLISRIKKTSQLKIMKEILLCIVMCANCHRKGHAGRPRSEHLQFFNILD